MGGPDAATESDQAKGKAHEYMIPTTPDTAPAPRQGQASVDSSVAQERNATLPAIDTRTTDYATDVPRFHIRTPSRPTPRTPVEGLHIITGATPLTVDAGKEESIAQAQKENEHNLGSLFSQSQPIAIGGLRSSLSVASMHSVYSASPGSRISSPFINALTDITPLPSPLLTGDSPGPWRKGHSRPGSASSLSRSLREEVLLDQSGEQFPMVFPIKMQPKSYGTLGSPDGKRISGKLRGGGGEGSSHKRDRSLSEFTPAALHNERPRNVTVGNEGNMVQTDSTLHREQYLAEQRGLVAPAGAAPGALPTPPASNRSTTESEGDEMRDDGVFVEYLTLWSGKRKRKYRPVRPLGQGTFSKVVLATSEKIPHTTTLNEASESWLDPKHLVAIKVVQHGPAGGADADRVDLGLKREIEILRTLSHPTLIHLQSFDWNDQEALIVLNYCPGGDLFDLASQRRDLLTPPVVQRMFAELVDAVRYLHSMWIVHRDIKLENVLLNIPPAALADITEPLTYPYPLITLTDLGLSRKIPQPPESPLLTTRCGSEDYTAPEILLGQPYDGRQTDAWAVGVLMYALMEGRLPFDPPPTRPGARPARVGRAVHRIARCDWMWCVFGNEDGEWEPTTTGAWEGGRDCVEALLKKITRGRLSLDEIAEKAYVKEAIPEGGLKVEHPIEEEDEE